MPQLHSIRSHLIVALSILFSFFVGQASWALALKPTDGLDAPVSLIGNLAILRDPVGTLKIEDIESGAPNIRFEAIPSMLTEGYRKGAIWVRFSLSAPASSNKWLLQIERPLIEHVTLYIPDEAGRLTATSQGRGDDARAYPALFSISVPAVERNYYIRLESMTSMTTSLRVWQKEGYEAYRRLDHWIIGIEIGAIGAMILANLLYTGWLRDSLYLLYAAVLFESGLVAIFHMGYASELLYFMGQQLIYWSWGVIVCLYSIVMVLFLGRLFEFRRHWPLGGHIMQAIALLNGVALLVTMAGRYGDVAFFVSRLQQLAFIFVAAFALYLLIIRKEARYILPTLAFAAIIFISLVMQTQYTGANPFGLDSSLARVMVIGTLIHLGLLSAAVAKRAHLAERRLSEEKDRLIVLSRSVAENLAHEVRDKTAELAARNASLKEEVDRRRLLEARLVESQNSVNESLARKQDFIALVSHEFRGPLGVIAATADNLSASTDQSTSSITLSIARIRRAIKRMSILIENLLADEQLAAGQATFFQTVETLDLNGILHVAKAGLDDDAAKRVRFIFGEQAMVSGDRNLLEIVLQNLIQNAIKYSDKHSIIVVQSSVDENNAFIHVIDAGIGVRAEERELIFQKYYRSAKSRAGGSGLGLYISREIARQHGGDLTLASSDANGSTFCFLLPIKKDEPR